MAAAVAAVGGGSPATAAGMVMGMVISASFLSLFASEAILVVRDAFNAKDHPLRWSMIALAFAVFSGIVLFLLVMADLRKVTPYKLVAAWWRAVVGYNGTDDSEESSRLINDPEAGPGNVISAVGDGLSGIAAASRSGRNDRAPRTSTRRVV